MPSTPSVSSAGRVDPAVSLGSSSSRRPPSRSPGVRWVALAWLVLAASGCVVDSSCPEVPCPDGAVCRSGTCVEEEPSGCGGCAADEICRDGTCRAIADQCDAVGDSCLPSGPVRDGFRCRTVPGSGEGICVETCRSDGGCEDGRVCAVMLGGEDGAPCQSDRDCGSAKRCVYGSCRVQICRAPECEGVSAGPSRCGADRRSEGWPRGARCYPIAGDGGYCVPAGRKTIGDRCLSVSAARREGTYERTCDAGLVCRDGTCVDACTTDADCPGDLGCSGSTDAEVIAAGVGECEAECEPFGEKSCPDGQTCRPVTPGKGSCKPSGSTAAYERCRPGAHACEAGTVCVAYQRASVPSGLETVARCHPVCDTSIGERGDEGGIDSDTQQKRDATCPQPAPEEAAVRIVHLWRGAGEVDVYVEGRDDPVASALAPGGSVGGEGGSLYLRLERGAYDFAVSPAGAPRTDLPLVEWRRAFGPGETAVFAVHPTRAGSDATVTEISPMPERSGGASRARVRAAHFGTDPETVDVWAYPPGTSIEVPEATSLGADLGRGDTGTVEELPERRWTIAVRRGGTDSGRRLESVETDLSGDVSVFTYGGGAEGLEVVVRPDGAPERSGPDRPRLRCVPNSNGAGGYCRQRCEGGASDYGTGLCDGPSMGCRPTYLESRGRREHLCGPVGEGAVGETCNPYADAGECGEGNYCLEYGNTREGGGGPDERGLCRSLCVVDGESAPPFACGSGRSCDRIGSRSDFEVGHCGIPCEADAQFSDPEACPPGLRSCRPSASLEYGEGQGDRPPRVLEEQSFCSVSGDVEPGTRCTAQNCVPRAECLYPRSEHHSFVESLLSPYVRSSGAEPTCRLRCDPFDGDRGRASCGQEETCLFNSPWSADVGHCAPISVRRRPGQTCKSPGLACGEDSICVARGDENRCRRFCDYRGPDAQGELGRSTCPRGYTCRPFVRDVGICRR